MITKRQFDILTYLLDIDKYTSQRKLAKQIGISLGTINNDLQELSQLNYVKSGKITQAGIEALKPYKVERAIFIAAGFGSRLLPITLNTPKPLIKVNGKRIIETVLDAVLKAGINEIYIVRGYLADSFDVLLKKYPMIKFVENPQYNTANNISSAIRVKDLYKNAYVFDADLILYNNDLISPYQYSSNYLGIPMERTDDWCLITKNNKVTKMQLGGRNCFLMYGISYWTYADGVKFERHIEKVYAAPGGKERYWDQVILDYYIDEYDVSVRICSDQDIVEIDTFEELKMIDKSYDV